MNLTINEFAYLLKLYFNMSLNLLFFTVFYLTIPLSIIGYGQIFFSLFKKYRFLNNLGYAGLTGVLIICIYSYTSSFFFAHTSTHNIIFLTLGIIFFIIFNFRNQKTDLRLLFILLIIYFIGMLIFKTHDDFNYYHFQYAHYLTQMPSVLGIGHFNLGLRTPSSIFYLNSLFYLPFAKFYMFQMAAFLIFLYANMILVSKILLINFKLEKNFLTFFYLLSFIFINIFFYRFSEHGTDRSAQILVFILVGEILAYKNIQNYLEENISKIFLIMALVISLKAFYILYGLLFLIILYQLIVSGIFLECIKKIFSNIYLYFFLFLLSLVIIVNFYNTGCLLYPVSITCFENNIWAIPKSEVLSLNNWYELWSKAGANPNFRVEDPENYIKKFNWVNNWFNLYFFTKVSDFILGIIFLAILIYFIFAPYNSKNKIKMDLKIIYLTFGLILVLFVEWFYNHPALRYGGYCIIALTLFLSLSLKISQTKLEERKIKTRVIILLMITITIFLGRNIKRIFNEMNIYEYKPLNNVYYQVEDKNFNIFNNMTKIIDDYEICKSQNEKCEIKNSIKVKKIFHTYVFYKK